MSGISEGVDGGRSAQFEPMVEDVPMTLIDEDREIDELHGAARLWQTAVAGDQIDALLREVLAKRRRETDLSEPLKGHRNEQEADLNWTQPRPARGFHAGEHRRSTETSTEHAPAKDWNEVERTLLMTLEATEAIINCTKLKNDRHRLSLTASASAGTG